MLYNFTRPRHWSKRLPHICVLTESQPQSARSVAKEVYQYGTDQRLLDAQKAFQDGSSTPDSTGIVETDIRSTDPTDIICSLRSEECCGSTTTRMLGLTA